MTTRDEFLQVRVSQAEKQAINEAARLNGQSISDWVRQLARKSAVESLKEAGQHSFVKALAK